MWIDGEPLDRGQLVHLSGGERFVVEIPGGGGWGDPALRETLQSKTTVRRSSKFYDQHSNRTGHKRPCIAGGPAALA